MTPQLFINMKPDDIPWEKQDPRYSSFWENEWQKVKNGITIDGYYFTGWLYWHINHWKINAEEQDNEDINAEIKPITPLLRDNEIIINNALKKAEDSRRGLCIMGGRQISKTTTESSYAGRAAIIFKNSQNLIMGTNAEDLNNITQVLDFGLLNCTPFFRVPRISRDWSNERVLLGVKKKSGDNVVHSTFVIRNTGGGKKTEKGAGVSNLKSNLWDEIGKDDFLQALTATKPAMLGANGWRTIPIAVGTGGNILKATDAKALFFNPEAHTFLSYEQPDGRKTGLYMPGTLRQDCKYQTTLSTYLLEEGIVDNIPEDSELRITKIFVSDKQLAEERIKSELDSFLLSGDIANYNRWRAYYPLCIDDIFLAESNNNFPTAEAKRQQENLRDYKPEYVEFFRNKQNKVEFKYSDKAPITKFPVGPSDRKEAPVCIYEFPEANVPHATYCIGIDPYNENTSVEAINSLGAIYVYKRMYNPLGKYQNSIVASWAGRCKEVKDFHQLCLDIAEFYNAIEGVLPENEDKTLIQFFFMKKKGHFLADSFQLSKEINPNTRSKREKGLAASTNNQRHYMNLMVAEMKDEIYTSDETGEEITSMGIYNVPDVILLEEMIQYKAKPSTSKGVHDGNYDRIVAFGHALTLAKYYDNKYPTTYWKPKEITEEVQKPPTIKTPWGSLTKQFNPFGNKLKKSPFKQFI